uniref:hypothetical protein n=1 Tax=Candidatus Electronema sp. TaxID=2698783 RepID=UPI0040569867
MDLINLNRVKKQVERLQCFSWIQVPSAIFWQVPKNSFFGVLKPRDFRGLLLIFSAMQLMSC